MVATTPEEPMFDVAQFSSIELFSPCVDESVWFFKDLLGMVETGRAGDSVYLRAFEDPYLHSLKLTYGDQPGLGFAGWRAMSQPALERRAKAIEATGLGRGWIDSDHGHGPAYEFTTPDGHVQRIGWEVEYFTAPQSERSVLLNRPQRRPLNGVPTRRLDHLNLLSRNVTDNKQFFADNLGFKLREHIVFGDETEGGAWMSVTNQTHDIAFVKDQGGDGGRLHHVAFHYGIPQHLDDLADIFTDYGIEMEAGPARHAISQALFLYVLEPGGNRIELIGGSGYSITDPSWRPVKWAQDDLDNAIIWYGSPLPSEFDTYGTPLAGPTEYRTPNRYIAAEAAAILGKPAPATV
ncbi:VOC family protein [Gordonia bronchialis]|uniref:VOC family protein n=1 Tax=Gordonia bronchialis TaxID=2054 RepID=UPI002271CE13|nr:VOC family protein [Gordonia bronchialis]